MDAHDWFRFFDWFSRLPNCQQGLKNELERMSLAVVPEIFATTLEQACEHGFVERFDWLSTEIAALLDDNRVVQASRRDAQRNEILRIATAKRQAETKKKGVLFSSRRTKWEKDTEMSRLERQSIELKDKYAQQTESKRRLVARHNQMLESLNKLSNLDSIKLCLLGVYRSTPSGDRIQAMLGRVGDAQCHGWQLSDILEMGHLLPAMRNHT
jgi:hypothetical protein